MNPNEISLRLDEPVILAGAAGLVLWFASEWMMQLLKFRQPGTQERERSSWCLLSMSYYGVFIFPLLDAGTFHWTTVGSGLAPLRWLGVPLILAGLGIRLVSRLTLGKEFSGHVQTTQGHQLITTGIYRRIRHPLYFGYLFLLLGFPVCFGSIGGLACALLIGIPALLYRIRVEEAALEKWFPEYEQYRRRTCKLIPGVW